MPYPPEEVAEWIERAHQYDPSLEPWKELYEETPEETEWRREEGRARLDERLMLRRKVRELYERIAHLEAKADEWRCCCHDIAVHF